MFGITSIHLQRILVAILTFLALLTWVAQGSVASSPAGKELNFPLTRLTDTMHIIYGPFALPNEQNQGFRDNPLIVQTSAGVVLCDPGGSAAAGQMVVDKVKQLTESPIVAVFISHVHGDHWLGNEAVKDAFPNAIIYAHPKMNSKFIKGEGQRWLEMVNRLTKGKAKGTRVIEPNILVKNGDVINIGDTHFRIHHTGTAHTEGDIMIEIVEQKAIYLGDVVRNGFLGMMQEDSSFEGNIAAIDSILAKTFNIYIPAHGRVADVGMLKKYRRYLSVLYRSVKKLYSTGMADFEMKPEVVKSLAAFRDWSGFDLRVGQHISRAYLQIEAKEF